MIPKKTIKDNPLLLTWYEDLYGSALIRSNRYFLVALIAGILAIAQALILIFLLPLKTVEPYVIQVDPKSGVSTTLTPLKENKEKSLTEVEALTKAFIVKYVVARETYDPQDLNRNYDLVRLMSSSDESKRFEDWLNSVYSPLEIYKTNIIRSVRISSVSFLDKKQKVAQVRFSSTQKTLNEAYEEYWVAILTYRYINSPMDEKDRLDNPLGFQVLSYRVDQEIVNEK